MKCFKKVKPMVHVCVCGGGGYWKISLTTFLEISDLNDWFILKLLNFIIITIFISNTILFFYSNNNKG